MRKQVYSIALNKELAEAIDGAVHYFKYKSRSAFITEAVEQMLQDLHQSMIKEKELHEN